MKKIRQILTGVLLIMALSVFTACGNNDMAADEVDTTNENSGNTDTTTEDENQNADKNDKNNKNLLFEITDPELLEKTGGIVQGMSGSPIIQGDFIIGAVTHVVVDDPTKGYGILITNMLKEGEN